MLGRHKQDLMLVLLRLSLYAALSMHTLGKGWQTSLALPLNDFPEYASDDALLWV